MKPRCFLSCFITTLSLTITLPFTACGGGGSTGGGTGGAGEMESHQVSLTWNAPADSADPVAGYNVYRATGDISNYQLLNASPDTSTAYTDTTVQNATSYTYYVESVDADGNQSAPSNTYSVNIP